GSDASSTYWGAFKFDLSGVPVGITATSATLNLMYDETPLYYPAPSSSLAYGVYQMTGAWSSATSTTGSLSWNSSALATFSMPGSPGPQWMSWPLTATVNNWLSGA